MGWRKKRHGLLISPYQSGACGRPKVFFCIIILIDHDSTYLSPWRPPNHPRTCQRATVTMMATNTSPTQPTCQNCTTSTTPLWRRDEFGSVLCNACGLFLKLHGRPRPISLKTDVIKSRNRVKTIRPDLAAKKKVILHLLIQCTQRSHLIPFDQLAAAAACPELWSRR